MRCLLLTVAFATVAAPAFAGQAAEPEPADWDVQWEAGVVSDYRFRGYSLSEEGPAVQGGVTVSAPNGLYGFAWASTIDEYGAGADGKGALAELDLGIGYATTVGGFDIDVAAVRYIYPGGKGVDFWELPVSAARSVGPWTFTLGGAYVPEQDHTGGDNSYVYGGLDWTLESAHPVTLSLITGYEDGAFADGKTDWSLGASTVFGPLTLGLSWVDADAADVNGTLVASIRATF